MNDLEAMNIQHKNAVSQNTARSSSKDKKQVLTIIEPIRGWALLDWKELSQYKDLFYFLVLRDIKVLYKQTILGYSWAIIRPFISMVILSVVFGKLAKVPSDGIPYPIFSYVALLPWTYFSSTMTASTTSLLSDSKLFTKVYFPRLMIPLTPIVAKVVDFAISLIILAAMMVWYKIVPTFQLLYLPLLIVLMILMASGTGIWLAALTIQYRDMKHAIPFLTQVLMYAAPVAWPVSLIAEKYRLLYGLYPMAGVIEGFRSCLIGHHSMPWDLILTGTLSSLVFTVTGALYFRRKESVFADVF